MQTGFDLPPPDPGAREHSGRVRALVEQQIAAAGGFLAFADYMEAVLYAPGLGYYSAGAQKFGAAGDFVTAAELGPIFARCLARLAGAALRQVGGGVILEVGGGSGALAADILHALRHDPPQHYWLLEVSGDLRERQRQTIAARAPELLDRVEWLDAWPASWQGVLLANEVLDALPVERFRIGTDEPLQLGVEYTGGQLRWAERPAPELLVAAISALEARLGEPMAPGFTGEISLHQAPWLRTLLTSLDRGFGLFVDYGGSRREIYHPGRRDGTLTCHYRHRQHNDPFFLPGLQDLTAWVDFSAAASTAVETGFEVAAYATQAHVLLASGILDELQAGGGGVDRAHLRDAQAIQRLLLPGEMGERFKVLALTRGFTPDFPLTVRDLRARLDEDLSRG